MFCAGFDVVAEGLAAAGWWHSSGGGDGVPTRAVTGRPAHTAALRGGTSASSPPGALRSWARRLASSAGRPVGTDHRTGRRGEAGETAPAAKNGFVAIGARNPAGGLFCARARAWIVELAAAGDLTVPPARTLRLGGREGRRGHARQAAPGRDAGARRVMSQLPAMTPDCRPRAGRHGRDGRTAFRRRNRRCLRRGTGGRHARPRRRGRAAAE
jgi:hypothetical protein